MKPFWVIFAVFVGMAAFVAVSRSTSAEEIIPWRTEFADAQKESAASGKPMLLYFTASWCGPCQEMKRTTWADTKVEESLRRFVPVKIDVDANGALAQRYAIQSIPKVILIDDNGNSIRSTEGYLDPKGFLSWLAK